jgi:hypothetical protein
LAAGPVYLAGRPVGETINRATGFLALLATPTMDAP